MTYSLRKLDEEIARLRGWERVKRTSGILLPGDAWVAPECDSGWHGARWVDCNGVQVLGYLGHDPPPFSSSWALAGPLLEELQGDAPHDMTLWRLAGAWHVDANGSCHSGATPCEAIARAWVAWRRGRA